MIGGRVGKLRSGAKLGRGDLLVAEADESDGSFLKMKPTIAVVTNIDREHLDHYRDLAAIQDAFVAFLSRVPFYGAAVVCLDDPNVRDILPRVDRKVITYGLSSDAEVAATSIVVDGFEHTLRGARYAGAARARSSCSVPGRHVGVQQPGRDRRRPRARRALPRRSSRRCARFRGVDRRLQRRGDAFGALVIDDYGHHPTEISATLAAVREGFGARTIVVFQPHRYTRTRALLEEFGARVLPRRPGDRDRRSTPRASRRSPASTAPRWPTRSSATGTRRSTYEPRLARSIPELLGTRYAPATSC